MNIINKLLLRAALAPKGIYKKLGVNTFHLEAILKIKLLMDDRRPNTFQQVQQKKQPKPIASATLGTMVMSAFLGLFFLYAFRVGDDYTTHLTVYFSIYIFMLASTLISDFTSVLIDVRDNYIILTRPVNDRTVVLARLLHILIHISKLVVPMTVPAIVFMALHTTAWGTTLFLVLVGLNTLFTLFLINALYIIVLRITTAQKFQSVISYFQIGFAIFMYGGYQVALRSIDQAALQGYDISAIKYIWLAPSYWFAKAWTGLSVFDMQPQYIIAGALSFIIPLVSIWIVIKYFAPSFNQKLSQISASDPDTVPAKQAEKKTITISTYAGKLATLFTTKGAEHMGFLFCWKMTGRSKDFKMKVYPSFGYLLVYLFILFYNSKHFSWQSWQKNPTELKVILISVIYFSSLMLVMAINQVAYSEKSKAAWIYFTAPVQNPGLLISGAVKSIIAKFYLPVIAILTIPAVYLMGLSVIPNLLLGLSNIMLISALIAYVNEKYLPFSAEQSMANKSGAFIRGISILLIPGVLGLIHYFLFGFIWVVCVLALLSAAAVWLVAGAIKKTAWSIVKSTYE